MLVDHSWSYLVFSRDHHLRPPRLAGGGGQQSLLSSPDDQTWGQEGANIFLS